MGQPIARPALSATANILTRSIAESVFTTHWLDLDAIAHTAEGTEISNKTTQARAYHAPLTELWQGTEARRDNVSRWLPALVKSRIFQGIGCR